MERDLIANKVRQWCAHFDSAHDMAHLFRVAERSVEIGRIEYPELNPTLIWIAGLLHDVCDKKMTPSEQDRTSRRQEVADLLAGLSFNASDVALIMESIDKCGFRKSVARREVNEIVNNPILSCVQDADLIDAVGAVGIARAFSFGGGLNRPMWDINEFENPNSETSVGHFYDKLLIIPGYASTATGRIEMEKRCDFMRMYLNQLHEEIVNVKINN